MKMKIKLNQVVNYALKWRIELSAATLFLLSFILSIPALFPVALLAVSYTIGLHLPRTFFLSRFSSTIIGFSAVLATTGALLVILWFANINMHLQTILLLSVLLAQLITFSAGRPIKLTGIFDHKDLISIGVVLFYCTITVVGIVNHAGDRKLPSFESAAFQAITYGIDDISHLMMFNDTIAADSGLLLGDDAIGTVAKKESAPYPKMSHTLAAVFINNSDKDSFDVVLAYASMKFLLFAIAIYIVSRSSLEVLKTKARAVLIISFATPLLVGITILLVHIFIQEGFFSIWPILIFMPLIILFAAKDIRHLSSRQLLLVSAMTIAIMFSWPIMGLAVYVALFASFLANPFWKKRHLAALLLSLLGLVQLYVQFTSSAGTADQSLINAPGGIPSVSMMLFGLIFGLALYGCLRKRTDTSSTFIISYVLASILLCTLIACVNLYSTSELQYFFYKTTILQSIVFTTFALPVVIASMTEALSNRNENIIIKSIFGVVLGGLLAIAVPLMLGGGSNILYSGKYLIGGDRHVLETTASAFLDERDRSDTARVIFISADNKLENYYINAVSGGTRGLDSCLVSAQSVGIASATEAHQSISRGCLSEAQLSIIVVDSEQYANQLTCHDIGTIVGDLSPKVHLRFAGSTSCP